MSHYLLIGSGLIGRLTAWRLLEAGHDVAILSNDDRRGSDSAGYAAAGMVAPATEAISGGALLKTMGQRSLQLWSQWLKELCGPVFYQQHGTLVVAHAADQSEMERFQRQADYRLEAADFHLLDKQALHAREAELADRFQQALYFPAEACLDNRQLYQQLEALLSAHSNWQHCEPIGHLDAQSIDSLCRRYLDCAGSTFDAVLDCRGNGGKANLATLRSVRGEILRVHAPAVDFRHAIRLLHPRYPLYLAPRADHYVLGATVIESDDRSPISVRSALELLSALYSLHPGFAEARVQDMGSHCRPALPHNLPTIDRRAWGYCVNGFYRHGYLLGPAVVEDLLTLLENPHEPLHFGDLYDIQPIRNSLQQANAGD